MYKQSHPTVSYVQKAKTPVSNKTTVEGMSAMQLVHLLKSLGLSMVASEGSPDSVAPVASTPPVAPSLACGGLLPLHLLIRRRQNSSCPSGEAAAAREGVDAEGRTLFRGRRYAAHHCHPIRYAFRGRRLDADLP